MLFISQCSKPGEVHRDGEVHQDGGDGGKGDQRYVFVSTAMFGQRLGAGSEENTGAKNDCDAYLVLR